MPRSWDRQYDESAQAYEAFLFYRDLDALERNLPNAYKRYFEEQRKQRDDNEWKRGDKEPVRSNGNWNRWHVQHRWKQRAIDWDGFVNSQRDKAIVKIEAERQDALAMRRTAFRTTEVRLAEMGFAQVESILRLSLLKEETIEELETTSDGVRQRLLIKSVDKGVGQLLFAAAGLFRTSSDIGRKGLGIADDESDVTPEQFRDIFFKTRGLLERSMPAGAVPEVPAEINVNPATIVAPPNDTDADKAAYSVPMIDRPG